MTIKVLRVNVNILISVLKCTPYDSTGVKPVIKLTCYKELENNSLIVFLCASINENKKI